MVYSKIIDNLWTIKIHETNDFKGIISSEKIVLFSDKEIDVYGIFELSKGQIRKVHGFHNLRYKIYFGEKTVEFRFIEKS